jgi:hypothetical protein
LPGEDKMKKADIVLLDEVAEILKLYVPDEEAHTYLKFVRFCERMKETKEKDLENGLKGITIWVKNNPETYKERQYVYQKRSVEKQKKKAKEKEIPFINKIVAERRYSVDDVVNISNNAVQRGRRVSEMSVNKILCGEDVGYATIFRVSKALREREEEIKRRMP